MKTVIVVNGPPRAGKDTAIRFMRNILQNDLAMETHEYSSIDPVKMMLRDYVDLNAKTEADRRLLSVVGDALEEHSAYRTNQCMWQIETFFEGTEGVFFLHIREPVLIARLRGRCQSAGIKFVTVLLDSVRAEAVTSNPSDAGVRDYHYDVYLRNDGTTVDLLRTCRDFIKQRLKR